MPKKRVPIDIVFRWVRELYAEHGMFRYKVDASGNVTECSVGHTNKEGSVYFVKGQSENGDWTECINQAKKLRSDQCDPPLVV